MKPTRCPRCGNKSVVATVLPVYETEADHDGRTYSLTLADYAVMKCTCCGNQSSIDESSDRVTVALREAAGLLTPEQIRAGRTQLRLTQKELAKHLDLAESTLSRWETGGQIQQRCMDKLLRLFFDVPEVRRHLGVATTTVEPAMHAETASPTVSA